MTATYLSIPIIFRIFAHYFGVLPFITAIVAPKEDLYR